MNNPLFRFLEREVTVATKLLTAIIKYSGDIQEMCNGKTLATNVLRELCKEIHSDSVPKMWVSFIIDNTINLTSYIIDLQKRFEQFNRLIASHSYQSAGVWFGGLLFPEAYMTATRQFVAQINGWSLEELELQTERLSNQEINQESLLMTGMRIEGGNWT
jgi:dynein heavy chain 1, cytosolic